MRSVIQRVKDASVRVEGAVTGSISRGLLVYLGVSQDDSEKDAEWLAEKIANLRIFNDENGKMNLSLLDMASGYGVLAVSQFTLLAELAKGRRPFYGNAADPEKAKRLYEYFMAKIKEQGLTCEAGIFQTMMEVSYTNEGPVTIILDSP